MLDYTASRMVVKPSTVKEESFKDVFNVSTLK